MTDKNKITIFTDGGARGNPGPAAAGAVIYNSENKIIKQASLFLGETTNNQAEYEAVILGLQLAKKLGAKNIDFYLDSQLVVEQLNQKFKIKNPDLGRLFVRIWNLRQDFEKVVFQHIPREKNKKADSLVNQELDSRM